MKRLLALALLSFSASAYSDGSPWVLSDGSINLNLSLTSGSTEDFFIGDTSTDLGNSLRGRFVWLNASYGYDDIWAFDARTGYAESTFETNPQEQNDVNDTSFGVTYQFINEFEADDGSPTVAGRIGYTIGGDYETNIIDAIGDGASGFDISLLVGKSLSPEWSVFGDLTYRQRDSDVADGIKYLVGGAYSSPIPNLGFVFSLAGVRTDSDINIGDPDFGPAQFPQTNRDSDQAIVGVNYSLSNGIGFGFSYASLINGTNIADTDVATVSLGYSF